MQDSRSFEKLALTYLPILEHQTEQFEVATSKLAIGLRGMMLFQGRKFQDTKYVYNYYLQCYLVGLQNAIKPYMRME